MGKKSVSRKLSNGGSEATRIILIYIVAGGLWILLSDRILALLVNNVKILTYLLIFKGWFFVIATAVLLRVLIQRSFSTVQNSRQALLESERTLMTLLSNLPGMAYRCRNDSDWTMEFVSEGCYGLVGYPPSSLVDNREIAYADLIHPDDRAMVWNEVQRAIRNGTPFRMVYRIRSADGHQKWVWEQGRSVPSEDGSVEILEGFITEITDRKNTEVALRDSEEKHRALVENSSDAILMVDTQRRILSGNQAFRQLFGFGDEDSVQGKSIGMLYPSEEEFRSFVEQADRQIAKSGFFRNELYMKRRDGTLIPVEATFSAIKDPEDSIKSYVSIIRDISKRRQAEEELHRHREHLEEIVKQRTLDLEAAQKALIQKEKLKTLGAISAEIAHEIRNPLFVIGGFAKRLQKRCPDSSEVQIILDESQRLEKILKRIKDYLKPVEMRPRESSVNDVIRECLDLLGAELTREHVRWRLDLAPDLATAYVDPGILVEVCINVIRNGMKFMDKQELMQIRTFETGKTIQMDFLIPVLKHKIKDPEMLLLPFNESSPNIGLPLSHRLLRGMGGFLAYSQEGLRATFSISVPKHPPSDPANVSSSES